MTSDPHSSSESLQTARARQEARFLQVWGQLGAAGAPEADILTLLAEEAEADDLRRLAASCVDLAGQDLGEVLDEAPRPGLPLWLQALLTRAPRRPELLLAASELRAAESAPTRPGQLWERLALLAQARAPAGEALGAAAREARNSGRGGLAEALYGAAKLAREGEPLGAALAGAGGFTRRERLALTRAGEGDDGLQAALRALAALAAIEEGPASARPPPEDPEGDDTLGRIADAASAGFGRLVSGLEGMLSGRGGGGEDRSSILREVQERRRARSTADDGDESPAPPPASPTAPGDPDEPAPAPESAGKKKTIGADSGPVRLNELHGDPGATATSREGGAGLDWDLLLEDTRARLTRLERHPSERQLAEQIERDLAHLQTNREVASAGQQRLLDQLERRFRTFRSVHG